VERSCTSPRPEHGGRGCSGPAEEAGWSCGHHGAYKRLDILSWDACISRCVAVGAALPSFNKEIWVDLMEHSENGSFWVEGSGGGCSYMVQKRTAPCNIKDKLSCLCRTAPAPVDGGWSGWRCEGSTISRTCNHPPPAYGGATCQGSNKQTGYSCGKYGAFKSVNGVYVLVNFD